MSEGTDFPYKLGVIRPAACLMYMFQGVHIGAQSLFGPNGLCLFFSRGKFLFFYTFFIFVL